MTPLSPATLDDLPAGVARPGYDRQRVRPGIVHLGVGGFHRAHQAVYLDRLLAEGLAEDWAVCGVGVLPGDAAMRDALVPQEGLYALVLKHPDGRREAGVVGSLVEYLLAPDDPEAVVERMADASTRIVSLTITEGGYLVSDVTGRFAGTDPAVQADLEPGAVPRTVFGLVVEALVRRRGRGLAPFTVMSCDNLQGNGAVARLSFSSFARLRSAELGDWVEREVSFPSSMVDRITPATTPEDVEEVAELIGVRDRWPVVAEPFTQWVLEDDFPLGRPPLERAGVTVVHDVEPYELMKLRLLNAGHQVLSYVGMLAGYTYVHEAAQDPVLAAFLLRYLEVEATPTLLPLPGVDLEQYRRTLLERFANPYVRDTLARTGAETSDRIPKFLLPVVRAQLERGGPVRCAAAVVASWARYAEGVDDAGRPLQVVDRLREPLQERARRHAEDPDAFLQDRALFGDLVDDPRFLEPYRETLAGLRADGAAATLRTLLAQPSDGPG